MRVLQLRRELDLALEPVDTDPGCHLGREHLHDHLPPEAHLLREEHAAHPAPAELALDAVGSGEHGLETLSKVGHARMIRVREGGRLAVSLGVCLSCTLPLPGTRGT